VNECFEFGWRAFDIAERLQTPVFVLSDLDFGMNQWMTLPFEYPETSLDRGKILWEEDMDRLDGQWARYKDIDGDAIPYRTLPGNRHPKSAYFARGTGHDENARYSEDNQVWHDLLIRLKHKYENARGYVPKAVVEYQENADVGLVSFGSTEPAITEARSQLSENGLKTDFMRVRALPFTADVGEFLSRHKRNYVIEMNRDGQLHQLLSLEHPEEVLKLKSIAFTDGLPLTARFVREAIMAEEAK
jgi:2-oxoglutarate ferredoxin oxidoreductase subunit alpha